VHSSDVTLGLARRLSCTLGRKRVICLKSPTLTYPTCIWRLCWGDPVRVLPRFWHQKARVLPWVIVWRCLRDHTFSRSVTPTCDTQTDRQTDRHTTTDIHRASMASRSKIHGPPNIQPTLTCKLDLDIQGQGEQTVVVGVSQLGREPVNSSHGQLVTP